MSVCAPDLKYAGGFSITISFCSRDKQKEKSRQDKLDAYSKTGSWPGFSSNKRPREAQAWSEKAKKRQRKEERRRKKEMVVMSKKKKKEEEVRVLSSCSTVTLLCEIFRLRMKSMEKTISTRTTDFS